MVGRLTVICNSAQHFTTLAHRKPILEALEYLGKNLPKQAGKYWYLKWQTCKKMIKRII